MCFGVILIKVCHRKDVRHAIVGVIEIIVKTFVTSVGAGGHHLFNGRRAGVLAPGGSLQLRLRHTGAAALVRAQIRKERVFHKDLSRVK